MEAATKNKTQPATTRLQQFLVWAWNYLSNPGLIIGLIAALAAVTVLGLVVPQQLPGHADAAVWISRLPAVIRPWGQPLYFLGLAHIFSAWWFWLPVALLLLHSLVMLANLLPGVHPRLRLTPSAPPLTWQHPLARRIEHVVRLSRPPDEWLLSLQKSLLAAGFTLNQPAAGEENRLTGAVRHRWGWLDWPAIYAGLVLLVVGLLISHTFLTHNWVTLFPDQPQAVTALGGQLEQAAVLRNGQPATALIFSPADPPRPALAFAGALYRPLWLNHNLIIPFSRQPLLTVTVRDANDESLKLIPVQEDLPPDIRIYLPLTDTGEPLYFLIPSRKLAVQISPNSAAPQTSFNVQARRGAEAVTPDEMIVEAGQSVALDGLHINLGLDYSLSALVYFDPALTFYLLALLLIGGGLLLTFAAPPVQLWLVPEVKGLGGQLYGVIETTGPVAQQTDFLERLLSVDE